MQEELREFLRTDLRRKLGCADCNSIVSDVQINFDSQRGIFSLGFDYGGFEVCFGRMHEGLLQNVVNGSFLGPTDKTKPLFKSKNMIIDLNRPGAARSAFRKYKEVYRPKLLDQV